MIKKPLTISCIFSGFEKQIGISNWDQTKANRIGGKIEGQLLNAETYENLMEAGAEKNLARIRTDSVSDHIHKRPPLRKPLFLPHLKLSAWR
ncbi:hypothetical protein [Endozoicomonas sp. SCSIO W0465]|uniref:hypothetical protein n=1 Tax=Endozoicomonas sp. SCSIO W0465 TaxID=2918516 RepID=UPI0020750DC4|nr:hypothetical protein [Endozoicomonas sp. SCSIO W0465]USE37273.1 hypothetical protein MJO57_03340 [Endozoicomonas sp. SCSIO W0465]